MNLSNNIKLFQGFYGFATLKKKLFVSFIYSCLLFIQTFLNKKKKTFKKKKNRTSCHRSNITFSHIDRQTLSIDDHSFIGSSVSVHCWNIKKINVIFQLFKERLFNICMDWYVTCTHEYMFITLESETMKQKFT